MLTTTYTVGVGLAVAFPHGTFQQSEAWMRYSPPAEEFSALLPEEPSLTFKERPNKKLYPTYRGPDKKLMARYQGRVYAAYSNGVVYLIVSENNPNHAEDVEVFVKEFENSLPRHSILGSTRMQADREIRLNQFSGKRYLLTYYDGTKGTVDFWVTDQHVYLVEAVGSDESNMTVQQFLSSFSLDRQNPQNRPSAGTVLSSPLDLGGDQVFSAKEVDHKALAVFRPEPSYTEDARNNQITGTVILRATLSSSGKVINIEVRQGLKNGLTERAIEAARQLKFIPATKNGRFVSQYAELQYVFNLY